MYVAGFERGVLPIGDWSIAITLSILSIPEISLWAPELICVLEKWFSKLLSKISFIKVDFPDPDTPVTDTNSPKGISTSRFFKLFSDAFLIINDPSGLRILFSKRIKESSLR